MELEHHITFDKEAILSTNLCDRFGALDLNAIGSRVKEGYLQDEQSRSDWRRRMQAALDLAMQVVEAKTYPWPGAANVAFPLVTIAAMQFHARAYPQMLSGYDVVKYQIFGETATPEEVSRARRIGTHMSYQLMSEDLGWEEGVDRLLLIVPILGCVFKKTYHSSARGHNVSELVLPQDLVVNYHAKSIESAPRKTHIIPLYRNEVYERCARGVYRDVRKESWFEGNAPSYPSQDTSAEDRRTGMAKPSPSSADPFLFLEQYVYLDLDGDGYEEPYIVTVELSSGCVVRIVANVHRPEDVERDEKDQILAIRPAQYFSKISFMPSPDGGIYDLGFGTLLGPLNESVNTLLNQILDSGTMWNANGGFLGRGAKIRGGSYTFAPFEWKRVDATGDDLRKSMVALEAREPSGVLFNALSLLIDYTNRISGAVDSNVGVNPGQNTPAETNRTTVAQGQKVYAAVFKRIWRGFREEMQKLYVLNGIFLADKKLYAGGVIHREDYLNDPGRLVPAADPNVMTDEARMMQMAAVKQAAMTTPGYKLDEVERAYLRALRVPDLDVLYPGPDKVQPLPNPKVMLEETKAKPKMAALQMQQQQFLVEMQDQVRKTDAEITKLQAQTVALLAQADGTKQGHEIAMIEASIGMMRVQQEDLRGHIELMLQGIEHEQQSQQDHA